ncbi:MAG: hypothetical protein DRK00_05650 [Thermoprotei archaeon]|nr:MAG: hypothetical protein DRK00_05650 [Thermoprotei archaeon]
MSIDYHIARIRELIEEAGEADERVSEGLAVAPVIMSLASLILYVIGFAALGFARRRPLGAALTFLSTMILSALIGLAAAGLGIYVVYKLIRRRNRHFVRARRLCENVAAALGGEGEAGYQIRRVLEEMEELGERDAVVWAVLSWIIPFLGLYVFHFLNEDFRRHEALEARFYGAVSQLTGRELRFDRVIPSRSTVLYIVLTIITVGIFAVYWLYTLARDPNLHFAQHRRVEMELLRILEERRGPAT